MAWLANLLAKAAHVTLLFLAGLLFSHAISTSPRHQTQVSVTSDTQPTVVAPASTSPPYAAGEPNASTPSSTVGTGLSETVATSSDQERDIYTVTSKEVLCNGTPLAGADPQTFVHVFSIPQRVLESGFDQPSMDNVGKDAKHVYSECSVLASADPSSFQMVYNKDGHWASTAKDASHVWYSTTSPVTASGPSGQASLALLPDADPSTFRVYGDLFGGYAADKTHVWRVEYYSGDNATWEPTEISGADPSTFRVLPGQESSYEFDWAADRYHVYYDGRTIAQADPATFQLVCSSRQSSFFDVHDCPYGKDLHRVFALVEKDIKDNATQFVVQVSAADSATFVLVDPTIPCGNGCTITAKDKYHTFDGPEIVSKLQGVN